MKNENSIENGECNITGITLRKNEEKILPGTIVRNPINGRIISIIKLTTDDFIQKSKKIHGDKYDYSKVEYVNSQKKVNIVCPYHGPFWQIPNTHLQGADCIKCGYDKTHSSTRRSKNKWVEKANQVHDNRYNYSKSNYINSYTEVIITCPNHGDFQQTPDAHTQGRGCPNCNFSKAERRIEKWLKSSRIVYFSQKTFDDCKNPKTNFKLRYDFYIPSKNLLIEYDGQQHFHEMTTGRYTITKQRLEDNKYRDKLKNDYAKSKGINLLRISYLEEDKMDEMLTKSLL